MASNTQMANVVVTMDGKQAEKMLEVLKNKSETLRDELRTLNNQRLTVGLTGQEAARFDALRKELLETKRVQREVAQQTRDVSAVLSKLPTAPIKAIKDAIKATETSMQRLDRSTEKYAEKKRQLALLRGELEKINNEGNKSVSVFDQVGQTMKHLASYVLVYAGFNELTAGLRKMYDMNILLSDQLADIEKTTGITGQELAELSNDINKINTRTSVEQLNNLAVVAGKIGIKGRENVLEFVKAGNQINVALGEDLGEDAIKNIAKLNDVLGITKDLGVEKALLSTGSAINELGQSSTASEAYLVDFGQRLGGIASQAGITMQQILALGSVADQLGQNVEVSATALNKFITSIVANTDKVAKAIGVTGEELRSKLDKSTWEGLIFVLEKLNGKGGLAGLAPIMGDLGSDGARLTAVLSALAQNYKMLGSEVELSNKAFSEATSLTNETLKKENSLAGVVSRISKNISTAIQNTAFVEKFKELALYIENATSKFDDFGNKISGAANLIITIVGWLTKLGIYLAQNIDIIARLAFVFSSLKIAVEVTSVATKAYTALTSAMISVQITATTIGKAFAVAFYTLTGNTQKASIAMAAFNALTKANPWVLVGTALLGVGAAIYGIVRAAGQASREYKAFQAEMRKSISAEQVEAEYLFSVVKMTAEGTEKRKEAIDEINNKYGQYLPNLLTEKTTTEELATALKMVNDELQNKVALDARETEKKEVIQTSITDQQQLFSEINKNINASDDMVSRIDSKIKDITKKAMDRGLGIDDAARAVNGVVKKQFSNAVDFTASYYHNVYDYVKKVYEQEAKLKQINQKFSPFIKEINPDTVNSLAEGVTVTGTDMRKAQNTESEKEIKKRLQQQQAAIDLWLQQKKNSLAEGRLAEQDSNSESYISEKEYNKALEALEIEALRKRLAIQGLEPEEIAKIEGQILDIRKKMVDDVFKAQQEIDKILLAGDPVKKENKEYEERLRSMDLFGKERATLTKEQQDYLVLLEEEHDKKIKDIEYRAEQRKLKLAEKEFNDKYQAALFTRNKDFMKEQGILDMKIKLGMDTDQSYSEQMDLQAKKMTLLYDELEARKAVGADTMKIQKQIADEELRTMDMVASHFKAQMSIYKQYGGQLGEAFGQLFTSQEEGLRALGDATIDILFDVLDKIITSKLIELAATGITATGKATAESFATPDAVLTFGATALPRIALMTGLIAAGIAAAKAGLKALIKSGRSDTKVSTPTSTTGNRVVKSSGFSSGGYSGDGGVYEVKGFVHGGEYIIPQWMMKNPLVFDTAQVLENIRQTRSQANPLPRQGYAEGGPVQTNIPIAPAMDPEMRQVMRDTKDLLSYLKNNGVITKFNISHFNEENSRYEASRRRGTRKS